MKYRRILNKCQYFIHIHTRRKMALCHGPLRRGNWPNCHLGCVSGEICTSRSLRWSNLPFATSFDSMLYSVFTFHPLHAKYALYVQQRWWIYVSLPMIWSAFHVSLCFSFSSHQNAITVARSAQVVSKRVPCTILRMYWSQMNSDVSL